MSLSVDRASSSFEVQRLNVDGEKWMALLSLFFFPL